MTHPDPTPRAEPASRTPMVIGAVFVLLGGIFIGALGTTVMLRTSIGSAGDLKAREAIRLQGLLAADDGRLDPAQTAERATAAFAHSFVVSAAALDAVASLDDRQRMLDIARWLVDTGALADRRDAVSRWAQAAAHCLVATPDQPRTAANCVRDAMPDDVPRPDRGD
ncbi:hypothetical protein [Luteimonas sp. RC10]|uniref:hypothetical protein n=1 Tax=Luteimonas sp. RC10 TaxID=2587035 RepID=UPI0016173A58|nr:hypothetical protein [Luteimonas sp. RC10]MBB3342345.1 hypothetical protein [Luteimonas sp. RC10]